MVDWYCIVDLLYCRCNIFIRNFSQKEKLLLKKSMTQLDLTNQKKMF